MTEHEELDHAIRECVWRFQRENPAAYLTPAELVALVEDLDRYPETLIRARVEHYLDLRAEFNAMRRTRRRR